MILYPKARSMLDQQFIPGPLKILVGPAVYLAKVSPLLTSMKLLTSPSLSEFFIIRH